MGWDSDDCDCAEDWTCMRHRNQPLFLVRSGAMVGGVSLTLASDESRRNVTIPDEQLAEAGKGPKVKS
jgi:hypothetical protein